MNWSEGYISDVAYPPFFYREMQPLWLSAVAGLLGFRAPDITMPFTLCDLGCGVGINLLIAAACHPHGQFLGVDANEAHIGAGRSAAAAAGIENVTFLQQDFACFADSEGPPFDMITCHGSWSWIAPRHRTAVLDIVRRRIKPGGLLHLHYMCHPGSTDLSPIQHLLNLCAHHLPGTSAARAKTGLALLRRLADHGLYADRPDMSRHLERLEARPPADVAHEFLTDHWHPQHSADVHRRLADAGLAYIGSADVFGNLEVGLSVPGRLQPLIRAMRSPALSETLKDMARHAHQRSDLFQRGSAAARRETDHLFGLLPDAPPAGPIAFATPIGTIEGPEAIFTPLLRRLADGPVGVAELARLPVFGGDAAASHQALQLLMLAGIAHPVLAGPPPGRDRIARLQDWLDRAGPALTIVAAAATAVPRRHDDRSTPNAAGGRRPIRN